MIISVFDITGKELEVLVNEKLQAGTYQTNWNASNFSSGVYFYRIQAGEYSETKKMLLNKIAPAILSEIPITKCIGNTKKLILLK